MGGIASIALAGGPVIGGVLFASVGWRAIFFINLPLRLLGIWLTWRYASESTQSRDRPLELAGQLAAVSFSCRSAPARPTAIFGGRRS
jgi:MFS transporter, DHA2 family, methylenomycin A resistance protein